MKCVVTYENIQILVCFVGWVKRLDAFVGYVHRLILYLSLIVVECYMFKFLYVFIAVSHALFPDT